MTLVDKLLLYLFSSVFFTLVLYTLFHELAASIFASLLLVAGVRVLFLHVFNRRKRKSVIGVAEMENALSVMGSDQTDYFLSALPKPYSPEKRNGQILLSRNGERILVCANYKFSPTNRDDAARFYRIAKQEKADRVYVLGRAPDRLTRVLVNSFDRLFTFVPSKKVHKYLRSQNVLMPKPKPFRFRKKIRFSAIFQEAFTKKRAKYFALSGLSISALAFFTPYRTYYFVTGAICLALALFCALQREL